MAQQTFAGVPAEFTAGEVLSSSDQNLLRNFLIAQIKEGMTGDTGEILPMIMDLTNNRIVLDAGGLEFSNGSLQTVAAVAGITWSGSTANGLATYGSSSSVVAESTATYDGTTLELTGSGGGLKLDGLNSSNANTLDDYEEGYFTVAFSTGSGSITVNSGTDQAYYVKIGQTVHIQGEFDISAISSPSGQLSITGLPFAAANLTESADRSYMGASLRGTAVSRTGFYGWITNGGTYVGFSTGNGETSSDANVAEMVDGGSTLNIGGTYVAAT